MSLGMMAIMHVLVTQQTSPLLIVGFFFLAYSMLGAMGISFWLYKRSEQQARQIKSLRKNQKSAESTD